MKPLQKLKSNSINSVSFGTEAEVFNKLGLETIVCGPGNIEQAHKPNEYIEESQIIKCQNFLKNIIEYLSSFAGSIQCIKFIGCSFTQPALFFENPPS